MEFVLIHDLKISNCFSKMTESQCQRLAYLTIQDKDNNEMMPNVQPKSKKVKVNQWLVIKSGNNNMKKQKTKQAKTKCNPILTSSCSDFQHGVGAKCPQTNVHVH